MGAANAPLSPWAVFRNRNFTLLWSAQLVSTVGSALTSLAASILIYRATGSALSVGLMLIATAAPGILLGLVAGVFVDRLDRRRVMLVADILRGLLVLTIPLLVPSNLLWLYIIVFLTSAVGQFFDPAQSAALPDVASDEELAAANSLMAISSFGATAVGFAASGLLASVAIELAYVIDAATFFFSALCLAFVRLPRLTPDDLTSVATVWRNFQRGVGYLFASPVLRSSFILLPLMAISIGLSNALLLPFSQQALSATEFEYGIQEALTSLGFVTGSLLMARVADRLPAGQWLTMGLIGMGAAQMVYSQLSAIPVAFVVVAVSGFLNAPAAIARALVLQRNTPREMRGRVASVFFVTRDASFLVGMALTGLAEFIGVRELYFVSAVLVLIPGALALFLPGFGQPAAVWKRTLQLLRTAPTAPPAQAVRRATLADVDVLATLWRAFDGVGASLRRDLADESEIWEAGTGAVIVRFGAAGDAAFFVLTGRAIAGVAEGNETRWLETMGVGDFFGEIGALSGQPRTADVIAQEPTKLLRIPASALRQLMTVPNIEREVRLKFYERLSRTNLSELPRFAGIDQAALRELRQSTT